MVLVAKTVINKFLKTLFFAFIHTHLIIIKEPSLIPSNFQLVSILNPTTAKFKWDMIYKEQADNPVSGMKGKLTGFLVSHD